jgi:hypothetical protein
MYVSLGNTVFCLLLVTDGCKQRYSPFRVAARTWQSKVGDSPNCANLIAPGSMNKRPLTILHEVSGALPVA